MFTTDRNKAVHFVNVDISIPYILIDRIKSFYQSELWIFSLDLYSNNLKYIQGHSGYISKEWFEENKNLFVEEVLQTLNRMDFEELESYRIKIQTRRNTINKLFEIEE